MPELRIDPLTRRKVLIAQDRAHRPNDYRDSPPAGLAAGTIGPPAATPLAAATPSPATPTIAEHCPFCATHEDRTPPAVAQVPADPQSWLARAVPNKFPALEPLATGQRAAVGVHEVLVESPRHVADLAELHPAELDATFRLYRQRLQFWAKQGAYGHALLFKNCGPQAGASLRHVHSQLVVLPETADAVALELTGFERYRGAAACWFCDEASSQVEKSGRCVVQSETLVAFCPPAPRQPYETWILPREHAPRFEEIDDLTLAELAKLLHRLVAVLTGRLATPNYNLVLHSAPWNVGTVAEPPYHWHWELIPRVNHLAGLELGAGIHLNSLAPERAAHQLRQALAPRSP
jgi:UDPglucose--hexose-1-phosphate uridylyltransferase